MLRTSALLILSKWYKKSELSTRTALLYSASILSSAIAGLISAGILSGMDGVGGLAGWKWIFILEGVATVVIGVRRPARPLPCVADTPLCRPSA